MAADAQLGDKLDQILKKLSELESKLESDNKLIHEKFDKKFDEKFGELELKIENHDKEEPPAVDMNEIFLALYCIKPVEYRSLRPARNGEWKKEFGPLDKELCKLEPVRW